MVASYGTLRGLGRGLDVHRSLGYGWLLHLFASAQGNIYNVIFIILIFKFYIKDCHTIPIYVLVHSIEYVFEISK